MAILHLEADKTAPTLTLRTGTVAVAVAIGLAASLAAVMFAAGMAQLAYNAVVLAMLGAALIGIRRGQFDATAPDTGCAEMEAEIERRVRSRTAEVIAEKLSLENEMLERRLAEERAAEGKRRLEELIMRTGTATVLIDATMRIVEGNHALARLLGRASVDELIGRDLSRLLGMKGDATLRHFRDEALRLGSFGCEFDAVPPARGAVSVEANGVSAVVDGRPCVMALLRDVSERRAAARELMQSREALGTALDLARQANESKSVFLAKLNHELRTPLNGIVGLSEILRHKSTAGVVRGTELRQLCDSIHQSGVHMLSLVDDLIDLSRLDTGNRALDPVHLRIRDEIDAALAALGTAAGGKRIRIDNACEADVAWMLDRRSLRQIIINLVGNAVKFSPPDSRIHIGVTRSTDALALHVSDQGPGIAREERARILAPFGRGHQAEAEGVDGQGLGLAIVSELLAAQGGSLEIESAPGRGSTFTAVFPLGGEQQPVLQLAAE